MEQTVFGESCFVPRGWKVFRLKEGEGGGWDGVGGGLRGRVLRGCAIIYYRTVYYRMLDGHLYERGIYINN